MNALDVLRAAGMEPNAWQKVALELCQDVGYNHRSFLSGRQTGKSTLAAALAIAAAQKMPSLLLSYSHAMSQMQFERTAAIVEKIGVKPKESCRRYIRMPNDQNIYFGAFSDGMLVIPAGPSLALVDGANMFKGGISAFASSCRASRVSLLAFYEYDEFYENRNPVATHAASSAKWGDA